MTSHTSAHASKHVNPSLAGEYFRPELWGRNMSATPALFEDQLEMILKGEGLEVTHVDVSPEEAQAAVIRKSVCYIVASVIFNDKDEVLMVQEAKPECYGRWYLPAGRMEEKESIVEAMMREVKEEAGLECRPVTLLLVEEEGPRWIRFVFLAEATGGFLKTEAEADGESLQAQWWDRCSALSLRARDILTLIDAGLKYSQHPWFPLTLPIPIPCHVVCQRLLVTYSGPAGELWVLVAGRGDDMGKEESPHLPVVSSPRTLPLMQTSLTLLHQCMPSSLHSFSLQGLGLLGLQHHASRPGQTDGICFNTLACLRYGAPEPPPVESCKFQWQKVENVALKGQIQQRVASGGILPVRSFLN